MGRKLGIGLAAALALLIGAVVGFVLILGPAAVACPTGVDATNVAAAPDVSGGSWVDPVTGRLSSPYGFRHDPLTGQLKLHDGQDIAAPLGTTVVAASGGVATVGPSSWAGPHLVTIDHGGGVVTVYGHMVSAVVTSGQTVTAGQIIGKVGSEGRSTGPHLHVGVEINGHTTDPVPVFKSHGIALGSTPSTVTSGSGGGAGVVPAVATSGGAVSATLPTTWSASGGGVKVTLDATQLGYASTWASTGSSLGVSDQGIEIAFMTVFVESHWTNYANRKYPATVPLAYPKTAIGSDHDSVGLAQQRPAAGWGDPVKLMDPANSARAFFGGPQGPNHGSPRGLLDIPNWQSLPLGEAAQKVQVSAFPSRYAAYENVAAQLLAVVKGTSVAGTAAATPCPGDGGPVAGNPGAGGTFTLGTFNVLGASHTNGGDQHPSWPGGQKRIVPAINRLQSDGVTVAGLQEFESGQARVFDANFGAVWGSADAGKDTRNRIIWRKDTWDLVSQTVLSIPYIHSRQGQPAVQLRMKSTGAVVWLLNVHNPSNLYGSFGGQRAEAVRLEKAFIARVGQQGIPVFLTGDFNDRSAVCDFQPEMTSAFGPVGTSPCRPPGRESIDKLMGRGAVTFTNTKVDKSVLGDQLSDHPISYTTVAVAGSNPSTTDPVAATSASAQTAISFAMSQRGKPYVWGATGPNAWDCSGLMQAAWRTAGVSLPRVSRDQAKVGQAVTFAQLQPGDLIFFYSPVAHVAMYIGNGQMVHAANPRRGVRTDPVSLMRSHITGIRRLVPTTTSRSIT